MSVVDIILTAGQSQMSGMGTGSLAPACDATKCWDWDGGLPLKTINDPSSCTNPLYYAQTGSPVPAFANYWTTATGRPVMVVRAAVGGTALLHANAQSQGDWSTAGANFGNSVSRFTAAKADLISLGHTVGRVHVIWSQGYRDAVGGNDLGNETIAPPFGTYGNATAALVSRWRAALGVSDLRVYIEEMYAPAAAPNQTVRDNCNQLRQEQVDAVAGTPGLVFGFTEGDTYASRNWLNSLDHLHYTQAGLNYMGRAYGAVMVADLGIVPAAPQKPQASASLAARLLSISPEPIPAPIYVIPGTYSFVVPAGISFAAIESEGAGGSGGGGGIGLKGGAGGGGAYSYNMVAVTPGETLNITVGAGGAGTTGAGVAGGLSQVVRASDATVLCKAVGGQGGAAGAPTTDGAGGAAASCVGSVKTSGQGGGVSGIDNGGAGAAPLGGAGGPGPGPNPGVAPGGGGAGANPGTAAGGAGAAGVIKIVLT